MQEILTKITEIAGTDTGVLVAIGVLACLLGAEIAGICILIGKMIRARRARCAQEQYEKAEDMNASFREYAIGAVLFLGAVPQGTYLVLTGLAAATAIASLAFLVLLIVFRVCGYDFASTKQKSSKSNQIESTEEAWTVQPDAGASEEDEAQSQEAYTPIYAEEEDADEPYGFFEEPETDDASAEEVFSYTEPDEIEEAPVAASEEISEVPAPAAAPVTADPVNAPLREAPVYADGSQPYRVVEKYVKETVKEVYKETPAPTQAPSGDVAAKNENDAVMEKLADFLDYELQKRKEEDAKATVADTHDVATFAETQNLSADEDEEDDEDEIEENDDRERDEDDDVDDEENDTDADCFTGNERILGFDDETGCYIVAHYRKSFEAKLIQSRANIKHYYSELKNALLSYGGNKSRISWAADSFSNGRTPVAKINVKTRTLELYLALDPESLEGSIYRGQDVGNKKKYTDTPFRYKVRSPRKLKWALELVRRTCEEQGLSPIDIEMVNYEEQYPFDTTDNLVARKLIKEYIRQEKPATTFELAPDHVPQVPDEDGSVIPANANFSWEFDNEVLEEKVEEPTPEPEPIPAPEPEPAPEPQPEPTPTEEPAPTVFRETTKITEMHYTEHYYGAGGTSYERMITTEEELPSISEPVTAEFEETAQESEAVPASVDTVAEEMAEEAVEEAGEEDTPVDPFAAYDELVEMPENTITGDATDAEEEALPFRPSYYANRNYYEDESTETAADTAFEENEEYSEETTEEEYSEEAYQQDGDDEESAADGYIIESEPVSEPEEEPVQKVPANPSVAVVDLCSIEEHFPMGAIISLETLREKELILPSATLLKVYASGSISKSFTVEANHFTLDAIQAITDADGDSVMVR